ncbi:MAG TPA: metallophosphoesterase [Candidatus Angelobacter sp.]|nr:metallophosphoesterase [Candidatus Angelobacter sp.]
MPALSPLPQTGTLPSSNNITQFTFVVSGDNRPAHKSCPQPPTPGKIFAAVKALNPPAAFVLWTGDSISGKAKHPKDPKDAQQIAAEYSAFLAIAKTAGVPVFNAPGNHEMDDSDNNPSDAMKKLYEKSMAGTYGAFTYGNSRFIALDSEHEPQSDASTAAANGANKTKQDAPGAITQKTLDLLKADLDADTKLAHVFIFMHHPVVPYKAEDGLDPASVQKLQALFANYSNVSYVVSGHEHMYYNPLGNGALMLPPDRTDPTNPVQPPFYLVSGGGGAPLKKNTTGSFFHYIVFQVNGATVTPTLWVFESYDPCDTGKETSPQ